jgi:hypothetical protein
MVYRLALAAIVSLSAFSLLSAAPLIEVTPTTFKCEPVPEGTPKVKASFTVKNTGDSLLRIANVRPGCGCTVARWDSLIEPGKSALISAEVNVKTYHSGQINKSMTVTSNAKNSSSLQLIIAITLNAYVECSTDNISFTNDLTQSQTVMLSSKMKELKVLGVSFEYQEQPKAPGQEWQKKPPEDLKFKYTPLDSTRSDGFKVFKLEIFTPHNIKNENGTINVKLNHPEKENLTIYASCKK